MSTCAVALADQFPAATPAHPAPPPPATRTRRHPSRYRYVRYLKAGGYQARVPLGVSKELARGKGESLNLGLYTRSDWGEAAEWAAGRAAKEFVRRMLPGRDICDVLESLKADGLVPKILQPTWVFARPDGLFGAKVRRRGRVFEVGPFPTAKAAHHAMRAVVVREFPLRPRLIDVPPPGPASEVRQAEADPAMAS